MSSSCPLPPHYGVVQLANGRFYPLYAFGDETSASPSLSYLRWDLQAIPFAQGPMPEQGPVSFPCQSQAIEYCQRDNEEFDLLWYWNKHACEQELYPERNVWYREEMERLACSVQACSVASPPAIRNFTAGAVIYASIWVHFPDGPRCLQAQAPTLDEAIVALYDLLVAKLAPLMPLPFFSALREGSAM